MILALALILGLATAARASHGLFPVPASVSLSCVGGHPEDESKFTKERLNDAAFIARCLGTNERNEVAAHAVAYHLGEFVVIERETRDVVCTIAESIQGRGVFAEKVKETEKSFSATETLTGIELIVFEFGGDPFDNLGSMAVTTVESVKETERSFTQTFKLNGTLHVPFEDKICTGSAKAKGKFVEKFDDD